MRTGCRVAANSSCRVSRRWLRPTTVHHRFALAIYALKPPYSSTVTHKCAHGVISKLLAQ